MGHPSNDRSLPMTDLSRAPGERYNVGRVSITHIMRRCSFDVRLLNAMLGRFATWPRRRAHELAGGFAKP